MKWAKFVFGIMVFVLSLTAPGQLAALFLQAIGLSNLIGTGVQEFIRNVICGAAFSAGVSWLWDTIKSAIKGTITGDKG